LVDDDDDNDQQNNQVSRYEVRFANLTEEFIQSIGFSNALDDMRRDLHGSNDDFFGVAFTQISAGSGMVLSVGLLGWVLQGGALATSLLSVMPMWSTLDPLPLLAARRRKEDDKKKGQKTDKQDKPEKGYSEDLNEMFAVENSEPGDEQ